MLLAIEDICDHLMIALAGGGGDERVSENNLPKTPSYYSCGGGDEDKL